MSDILRTNLTQANFEIITVRNGAEALKIARQELPDVVILDSELPDVDSHELCRQLKESALTRHIPVMLFGEEERKKARNGTQTNLADCYIVKPFNPKEVVSLVQSHLRRKRRAENISPLTGLPNQLQVSYEINNLIEQKKPFAAIFLDIVNLKIFNRVYDFEQGDQAIRLLGQVIIDSVKRSGTPDDLVGHLGGDDFIVITSPRKARTLCRRIIAEFDRRKKSLYNHEDLMRCYVEYENQLGVREQYPLMGVRAAVVTSEKQTFHHYLQVIEEASDQLEYLKRFPGVTSYYDLRENGNEFSPDVLPRAISREQREDIAAVQGVLGWLTSLTEEIRIPVTAIKDQIKQLKDGEPIQKSSLIKESLERLFNVIDIMESLVVPGHRADIIPDEINLKNFLGWIVKQFKEELESREIILEVKGARSTDRLMIDSHALSQCLQYILKGEIETSPVGARLQINISGFDGDLIKLSITNSRYLPSRVLRQILLNREGPTYESLKSKLYPARLIVQGLGGSINVTSRKTEGTTYTIVLPRRWQSWMPEVNALLFATDISRKQARADIRNIRTQLSNFIREESPELGDNLSELAQRVQELGVLCNRSLYLAENFNSRLEAQQDRLLQQEIEQISTLEAMQTVCREITELVLPGSRLFNPDSARRVARNALLIAGEFKLPESDTLALRFAALLKDLGLVLCTRDLLDLGLIETEDEAVPIKDRFNPVWKSLSMIPSFASALTTILYRYERFDGSGGRFGVSGTRIPLSARILAVADKFDFLTSETAPGETIPKNTAVQKIAANAGTMFDPDVVNIFLTLWKRQELTSETDS